MGIENIKNKFLISQLEGASPEWQAGYIPKDYGEISLEDSHLPPRGPLYNVNLPEDPWSDPDKYYTFGDPNPQPLGPEMITAGPLHYVDPNLPGGNPFSVMDKTEYIASPEWEKYWEAEETLPTKGAEWMVDPEFDFEKVPSAIRTISEDPSQGTGHVNLGKQIGLAGYTNPRVYSDQIGMGVPAPIHISDIDLARYGTTPSEKGMPSSPRNEQPIYIKHRGWVYPQELNRDVLSTVSHEIAHSINKMPKYEEATKAAQNLDWEFIGDISEKDKETEEMFNRAKDLYRIENNPLLYGKKYHFNDSWNNARKYIQRALKYNFKGGNLNSYLKKVKPQVEAHFAQMEKDRIEKEAKSGAGYYGSKDWKGGFSGDVTQKGPGRQDPEGGGGYQPTTRAQNVARTSSRVGPGGEVKAYGLAHGGLIDIPLSGRSRYI